MMRVLHSVSTYLNLSENWIYPQIVCVPNVQSRVVCGSVTNFEMFPPGNTRLLVNPPPWDRAFGIPRFLNALGRRIGCGGAVVKLKAHIWNPQILHAHFGTLGWEGLTLKRQLKAPLVTSFYGYDAWLLPKKEPVWRKRYDDLFHGGDLFLVEGPAMLNRLCELGCPEEKILIQRIGADLVLLPFETKSFSSELKVAMVGRFVEKKGLADGLRACALARSRGVNLSVTIVGDASADDPVGQRVKEELQAVADCNELSGFVRFVGFTPLEQTRSLLKAHNVFLCPSKHAAGGDAEGGSPVSLTEAMALGLLCIGARHCDIPEVIIDSETGFLCESGDISAMAAALVQVAQQPDEARAIINRGRQRIEAIFSLTDQLAKLAKIYAGLISRSQFS